ncbi:hypothetical protein [Myroides odoratimimus]|uniref:Uncharacterized protein n=1 Tax=Myroides odoratimimus CIP 101113 TaxID=883154 RepID=A0AAV3F727_9FLAO|nr:hypothetical protein [Myroides odoratimimus]EHO15092.1 hypothetical protein HMPREF9715_00280 [Myroides odoratimimus CIP 101113]EKB04519.1 hypothetical protein HMPREF9711_01848 [Myroides odoratimimus CCUG 3837]EPH10527.1 hypothetical protein HMPREF9713_02339 [Myroides odoratimimus CCUG 12700]SHK93876.1 hypothetical protein SAMN05444275_101281 [Myroides odoratimimus subsp. xuanwuensis]
MPKLKCECNEVIKLREIPSPYQYLMISDVEYDSYSGLVDTEELYSKMTILVKCPACHRMYIYNKGFNSSPTIYCVE